MTSAFHFTIHWYFTISEYMLVLYFEYVDEEFFFKQTSVQDNDI